MTGSPEIHVQTINHLGIIAGIIDEMGLVEEINQQLGRHEREMVSAGHIVKAMILNGLGFVTSPLYLRVADGNESDKAMFAQLIQEFRQQLSLESLIVADSALYSEDNIKSLGSLKWICRVPLTVAAANRIVKELTISDLVDTQLPGYKIARCNSQYGGIAQRWVIVESQARKQADIKQLYRTIEQLEKRLNQQFCQLSHQNFRCEADARLAAERFAKKLKYHALEEVTVTQQKQHTQPGRPRKNSQPVVTYRLAGSLVRNPTVIQETIASSGRFILATNVINPQDLSDFQVLQEYKQQQAPERGFRFLKDPLFFTSSICIKSPERVAAMAMVMGLCLLVYSLVQRQYNNLIPANYPTSSSFINCTSFKVLHLTLQPI